MFIKGIEPHRLYKSLQKKSTSFDQQLNEHLNSRRIMGTHLFSQEVIIDIG